MKTKTEKEPKATKKVAEKAKATKKVADKVKKSKVEKKEEPKRTLVYEFYDLGNGTVRTKKNSMGFSRNETIGLLEQAKMNEFMESKIEIETLINNGK